MHIIARVSAPTKLSVGSMGLRSFFKRVLPAHHVIREHKHLRVLGTLLHDPNLFHVNRHSAAGGVAIGLSIACLPLPGHMLIAAVCAILLRVNLPLAVLLVWLTNPFTLAPYLYLAYKTGALLLDAPAHSFAFEPTMTWVNSALLDIWQPLLLGCLVYGVLAAAAGYLVTRGAWRLAAVSKWNARKKRRRR